MLLNFVKLGELQLSGKTIGLLEIFHGGNFPGGNYPWWEFSRWELSRWELSGWEFSGWELSWLGIFLGGSLPDGNGPVGIIHVAIFRVAIFLVPIYDVIKTMFLQNQRKTLWLSFVNPTKDRSSRSQMFFIIGVLKH